MFEMNVPYDKGQMKIKLEDKNLAGVLEGRQSDYKNTLSENEILKWLKKKKLNWKLDYRIIPISV